MPTIIVETGLGIADANSYIDLTYLTNFATNRGETLPATDEEKEIFLIRANDYLETMGFKFKGQKTDPDQSLQWPRENAWLESELIENNEIPQQLQRAQAQLVIEQQKGFSLYPAPLTNTKEGIVIEKTIGPLKKKFSDKSDKTVGSTGSIQFAQVKLFLLPLMKSGSLFVERA